MTMLTTSRLSWFADTMASAIEQLPKVIADVRETVEHREQLIVELELRARTIDTLNLQIGDLKEQVKQMSDRLQDEYRKTARAEHLIKTTVTQLASSDAFHEAAQGLLTNGGVRLGEQEAPSLVPATQRARGVPVRGARQ